jgi:hypothetical protein
VKNGQDTSEPTPKSRRRLSLTWIDFLVIAATILTFAAVLDAALARSKGSSRAPLYSQGTTVQTGQLPDDPELIKARIRLAAGV